MRAIFICFTLGLIAGLACVSLPKPEGSGMSALSSSEVWRYCALEGTELGTFGRELRFTTDGKLELLSGYFSDADCVTPGPHMVSTSYGYKIGKEDAEGFIPLRIRSSTGEFQTRLQKINGYIYLPQNMLLPLAENPIDLNAPFSPLLAH
jgi:hypothetical protein